MFYVYTLRCADGNLYTGCTENLRDRFARHVRGNVPATARRLPVALEFYMALNDKYRAFEREKYLKSGSGRAFVQRHLA